MSAGSGSVGKDLPVGVADILRGCRDGTIPPEIALTRLIMECASPAELDRVIEEAGAPAGDAEAAARLKDLTDLARRYPDAWAKLRATMAAVPHDFAGDASAEAAVARLSKCFDKAAAISPEASVALYSLGDAGRLAAATAEIVGWMDRVGLLGPEKTLLDIGCGIGRLEAALHMRVGRIVGTEISPEMARIARQRCTIFSNVEIRLTSGLDLSGLPDNGFDCVIAVDTFPYLHAAGAETVERHFHEGARVLKPGGTLAILNYCYGESDANDRTEVQRLGEAAGLALVEAGTRPFYHWDASAFRLKKPS